MHERDSASDITQLPTLLDLPIKSHPTNTKFCRGAPANATRRMHLRKTLDQSRPSRSKSGHSMAGQGLTSSDPGHDNTAMVQPIYIIKLLILLCHSRDIIDGSRVSWVVTLSSNFFSQPPRRTPFAFRNHLATFNMASFLRRFMTTASAGKNMYFFFAAASAMPIYAVLNEPTSVSPHSPDSRANVFVRHVQRYKITI